MVLKEGVEMDEPSLDKIIKEWRDLKAKDESSSYVLALYEDWFRSQV